MDDYHYLKYTLMSASSEIRILTYGFLTSSSATTAVVSPGVLDCVTSSIKYLHDDADAHERGEILSITRRLLRRIQTSHSLIRKGSTRETNVEGKKTALAHYEIFTQRFYEFLKAELGAGLSYPRHILGLQTLQYFLDMTIEPHILETDEELVRSLCSLVLDPFDDVRGTAVALLHALAVKGSQLVTRVVSRDFLRKVELLATNTVRGDHADGMGRLWALWDALNDEDIEPSKLRHRSEHGSRLSMHMTELERLIAEHEILRPGSEIPVHGSLLAIYYRLRDLATRHGQHDAVHANQALNLCVRVWDHVRIHLCLESPENSSERDDEASNEGPKDLLAYSWRALRDSR
jgi:hypothetical protein